MTKVQLLKWLDGKQRSAVAEVGEQYRAAKEQLLAMKIEKSGYPELAASVLPLLQEVFDKLEAIHKDHEDLIGPSYYSYGELPHTLRFIFCGNTSPEDRLMAQVIRSTQMDKNLENQYETLGRKVKKTYETVAGNVRGMANAKQAAEYLKGLGFDLSKLETDAQAPTTALAAPVDRSYLLLEVKHEKG